METIKDHQNHFVTKPTKVIYFFREECSAVTELRKFFSEKNDIKGLFLRKIPETNFIESLGIEKGSTCIIFDDFHVQALSSEPLRETLLNLSSVWNHHYQIVTFYADRCHVELLRENFILSITFNCHFHKIY